MMKEIRTLCLIVSFFSFTLLVSQEVEQDETTGLKFIGDLDHSFWKLSVMTGAWARSGLGLVEVPEYLCDSSLSFPYKKRPYPKEYLFSDHVILVRTLGGWPNGGEGENGRYRAAREADIVYRGKDGQLKTRMNLLKNRIQPYIDAGYSKNITLVLDNIPFVFTSMPTRHKYGQASPPDNLKEWSWFIREIAEHLVEWYGIDQVKSWKFRLGTEWDNEERFQGSAREYFTLYKVTAKALMDVLGDQVGLGPFNASSNAMYTKIPSHPIGIDYFKLVNYIKEKNLPFAFAAFSDYSIPGFDHPNQALAAEPASAVGRMTKIFNKVDSLYPTKMEVHEFGVLSNEFNKPTSEPGARSAAINFNVFFNLWERGLSEISHWNYTKDWFYYRLPGKRQKYYSFVDGRIWSNCILEHMIGSKVYSLNKECDDRTQIKILLFEKDDVVYLVVSALNPDRKVNGYQKVTVKLPEQIRINSFAEVSYTGISDSDCVYRTIYEDLKAENNLAQAYNKSVVTLAEIKDMAENYAQSQEMVVRNYDKYIGQMRSSLTLKKYEGPALFGENMKSLSLNIRPTSNYVFCLKKMKVNLQDGNDYSVDSE